MPLSLELVARRRLSNAGIAFYGVDDVQDVRKTDRFVLAVMDTGQKCLIRPNPYIKSPDPNRSIVTQMFNLRPILRQTAEYMHT